MKSAKTMRIYTGLPTVDRYTQVATSEGMSVTFSVTHWPSMTSDSEQTLSTAMQDIWWSIPSGNADD